MNKRLGLGWSERYLGGSAQAEAALLEEEMVLVKKIQQTVAQKQDSKMRRGFHNKGDVLKVELQIAEDVPECLQTDFIKPGERYYGMGRFSRSQSKFGRDKDLDQRGFAFRVETPNGLQDFLFSNTPISFAEDPITFLRAGLIIASNARPVVPIKLIRMYGLRKGLRIVRDILGSPDRDLSFTCQRYWTRTPFQINDSAISFTVVPEPEGEVRIDSSRPDGLTDLLREDLLKGAHVFKLAAQFFVSEEKTPIENTNQEWREVDTPLVPFATVTLPQQDLENPSDTESKETLELEMAFNPWTTPCIQPLGAMNRSRREAYKRSAQHRGGVPKGV